MLFYQILTLLTLFIISFIPVQIDLRIPYIIYLFSIFLLPVFIKNFKEDIQKKNPVTIFFLLFLCACAIATLFSIDQNGSLTQLLLYCSYFVLFTSTRSVFPTLRSRELLATCYLLLATILSFISLYNTLVLHYVNRDSEGVSFMWIYYGHNHLSALLLFAIPISLYVLKKYWKIKMLNAVLLVNCYLLIVALFITFSRASIISLFLAMLLVLGLFSIKKRVKMFTMLTIVLLLALMVLPFGFLSTQKTFMGYKPRISIGSDQNRIVYWQQAIENFKQKPFLGSGLDTFRIVNAECTVNSQTVPQTYYVHNFFLQMLSDAGILGFLTSIGLIGSVLWNALRKISKRPMTNDQRLFHIALFVGILASTLNSMVDFDWQISAVFFIFWLIAGLLCHERV